MAASWRVTGQRQQTKLSGNSEFVDVVVVSFVTIPEDIAGTVEIPLRIYTPESVQSAIDARVAVLQAVHNL